MRKQSITYVLRAKGTDLYKIGHTQGSIDTRIRALLTGCPYDLEVIASISGSVWETWLHEFYAHKRTAREWFELPGFDGWGSTFLQNMHDTYGSRPPAITWEP